MVGVRQTFGVGVGNLGTALIRETGQDARTFVLKPMISDLSPSMLVHILPHSWATSYKLLY
jgi:hypothetical protein